MKYMNSYDGYLDHASKNSLTLLSNNNSNGSDSSDLAGAARIAPLIVHYYQEKDILYQYIKEETQLTHNNDLVVEIADFIGHVVIDVLSGYQPIEAIKELKKQYSTDLIKLIDQGLDNLDNTPRAFVQLTGQSCNLNDALPATVYFIAKYENDFKEALIANTLAGGDSAARGLIIGMVLGAYLGTKSIPEQWILDMKVSSDIKS